MKIVAWSRRYQAAWQKYLPAGLVAHRALARRVGEEAVAPAVVQLAVNGRAVTFREHQRLIVL